MITKQELLDLLEDFEDDTLILLSLDGAGERVIPLSEDYVIAAVDYVEDEMEITADTTVEDLDGASSEARSAVVLFPGPFIGLPS